MKLTVAPASPEAWSTAGPPDRTAAQIRSVRRITSALWAVTLLAALAELALTVVTWDDLKLSDGITSLYIPVAAVAYATLGVLIIRRAANLIGWIMLAEGFAIAFLGLTSLYAVAGVATYPGSLPAGAQSADAPQRKCPVCRFVCLTLHDRLSGFGEARSAAVEMGGGLVADAAVPRRAEPGELRVDPTAGARGGEREAGTVERLPGQAARPVLIPGWRGLRRALPIS